jgi:2-dehydropantoate 2-reductase
MKTLIVGLGNIGTIYGWALSEAGIDVTHVVRAGWVNLYEKGVKLDVPDLRDGHPDSPRATYHPKITEELSTADGYELVVVPTRGYQLADAVGKYKDLTGESTFLLFGANWEGPQEIDKLLPRSRYLWGLAAANGGRSEDDTLVVNLRYDYRLGALEGSSHDKLEAVIELFGKADLRPDLKENIIEWLWVHYAINAGLVGTALYAGGIEELANDEALMLFMMHAVRDSLKVLEKRGVDVTRYPDTRPYLEDPIGEFPASYANGILNTAYGQRVVSASHFRSSPEEMRRFYLDVRETGELLDVYTPHLDAMRSRIE